MIPPKPHEPVFNPRFRLVVALASLPPVFSRIVAWLIGLETARLERKIGRIRQAQQLHIERGKAIHEQMYRVQMSAGATYTNGTIAYFDGGTTA